MEISMLKALLNCISSFSDLPSFDHIKSVLVQRSYHKAEEMLKLLRPILYAIVDSEVADDDMLNKAFGRLGQSVDDLTDLFRNWQPLSSKIYFVLQIDALLPKMQTSGLDIIQLLLLSHQRLPEEFSQSSLELCSQKIKCMGYEEVASTVKEALGDQVEGVGPSSEFFVKIAENLGLSSNQEILIEIVALEKLKDNAEQIKNTSETENIQQMIGIVTRMHDRLVTLKQSQSISPVPIPPDFCCPLSLELMTDPVITSNGQTYERAFIKNWFDLGLTICPKTKQMLAHANLIPNYTVKALIANWCESNNVKLPDPLKSISRTQPSPPRESYIPSMSKVNRSWSPESIRIGSPSGATGNGFGLDVDRPRRSSEENAPNTGKKTFDSAGEGEPSSQSHNRTMTGDANETSDIDSHRTSYSSDASEEVKSDPQVTALPEVPLCMMELETRTRSQIWRRPSERFIPRIVSSSATDTRADLSGIESQVRKLVEDLKSDSVDIQREATAELRQLAKHSMDNRIAMANCGVISLMVNFLHSEDSKIQEDAVTTLLNLSINDNNKTAIADAGAIEPLIHVLKTGTPEAKENSAATLFSLSVIEDNKIRIGRSGAIGPLVDLLGNGTPRGKKDAATALFNLSIFHENKARIVEVGAVRYLVDLMDPAAGMVDKAVAVLANLATIPEGRTAIGLENGIPVLVEVVELGSGRGKENAAAALLHLCTTSNRFSNTVLQEGAVPPLVALSQTGTPRAKEKAQLLLAHFRNQLRGNSGRN